MSARKKKTRLRTIRLSEDIDDLLERDAVEQNISANALVGKIMAKYVEWDRIVDKIGNFSLSPTLFKALISAIDDEKLETIARDFAVQEVKNVAEWAFGKTDIDALLKALFLIGKYSFSAAMSIEIKIDVHQTITLHHDWGQKGVVFFRSFFNHLVRKEFGRQPIVSVSNDVITVSFPLTTEMSS